MSGAGPLVGLTIIDMAQMLAAPLAAMLLADMGATVIKVEPKEGDASRRAGWDIEGVSAWWRLYGRNKECIRLDLKQPEGVDILLRLVERADGLIENMRPGKLEALGLGPDALHARNPRLVLLRVTGWGQTGPYAERAMFGTQAEAMSGFAYANGAADGPPTLPTFPLADAASGYLGAFAVMAALWARERDPERRGQVIDQSILESFFNMLGPQASAHDRLGAIVERTGNRSPVSVPRGIYRARDGSYIAISCATDAVVARAFRAIERPELASDPRYRTIEARRSRADELDAIMQVWIGAHDCASVIERFTQAGATVAPVRTIREFAVDPHVLAREAIIAAPSDDAGPIAMQNVAPRFSRTPGAVRWSGRALGADNHHWLVERLGLSESEFAGLRRRGVI